MSERIRGKRDYITFLSLGSSATLRACVLEQETGARVEGRSLSKREARARVGGRSSSRNLCRSLGTCTGACAGVAQELYRSCVGTCVGACAGVAQELYRSCVGTCIGTCAGACAGAV
jgi:hypothetical protein